SSSVIAHFPYLWGGISDAASLAERGPRRWRATPMLAHAASEIPHVLKLCSAEISGCVLDVEEADVLGVALDEGAPGLDVLTHQHAEDLVGCSGIVDGDLLKRARRVIHRGLPQLLRVHLTETLVALDGSILRQALAVGLAMGEQRVALSIRIHVLVRRIRPLEPVQRRHREVDETRLDEAAHVTEQQG